ncbi:hypothetical protein NDU88_003856, partial [Pleurodeles waltl]
GKFACTNYVLEPDIHPGGYNKDSIPLEGMVKMRTSLKGRSTVGKIYISKGSDFLGWKHQKELGIKLDPINEEQVLFIDRSGIEKKYV